MLKLKYISTICILNMLFFVLFTGFAYADNQEDHNESSNQEFLVLNQESEVAIEGIYNKEGILLLPLQKLCSLLGLGFIECGRCGKDEIFNESYEDPKGHIFVNWYQNIISYSNDPTIIILDADNEKVNGVTYTSTMLYQYLGVMIEIDEENYTIEFGDLRDNADQEESSLDEGDLSDNVTQLIDNRIVYAYDPNCSSCEEITELVERIELEEHAELIKLDTSQEEMQLSIQDYVKKCKVPEELQGIYPMLFIRDQYLFYSEITKDNILALLTGNKMEHNLVTGKASGKVTDVSSDDALDGEATVEDIVPGDMVLIYFYSTTCASCKSSVDTIQMMASKYPELKVVGYNLYVPDHITLLKAYGRMYELEKKDIGEIPAVFFSDRSLIGEEITEELEALILGYDKDKPTTLINIDTVIREKNILNGLSVLGAGLLNGINPCSLSMFLFLLSLVMVDLKKVLKIGVSFCVGKFIMFFLLGTLFYRFMSRVDTTLMEMITQNLLVFMIIAFAFLNIYDFIMAKRENYDKMLLQLPSWLKGVNQRLMKSSVRYTNSKYLIAVIILIGMLLGFGEFLCSGQIYLTSIVVLIQGNGKEGLAVIYLILYSIAFVLPLFVLTMLVYYGKKVFSVSEELLEKLPLIKIVNSLLFIVYGLYVVLR